MSNIFVLSRSEGHGTFCKEFEKNVVLWHVFILKYGKFGKHYSGNRPGETNKEIKSLLHIFLSSSLLTCDLVENLGAYNIDWLNVFKVHIFWEGHKLLRNLHRRFDHYYIGQSPFFMSVNLTVFVLMRPNIHQKKGLEILKLFISHKVCQTGKKSARMQM